MGKFEELFKMRAGRTVDAIREGQRMSQEKFTEVVQDSALNYWRPGDRVPASGRRILLGVGIYYLADMRFLDALDGILTSRAYRQPPRVDVFELSDLTNREDIQSYFPGSTIFSDPLVGVWEEGVLKASGHGGAGRQLLINIFPELAKVRFYDS